MECPLSDFFASPWMQQPDGNPAGGRSVPVNSLPVAVNPNRGLELLLGDALPQALPDHAGKPPPRRRWPCYYQINYTLTDVPDDAAYFHAQFRRVNPLPYKQVYTILDGVKGTGHYVGTVMGVGRQQQRLVGRGRDQVLPRRRRRIPHHLRHRHRGLLRRRLRLGRGRQVRRPTPRRSSACTRSSARTDCNRSQHRHAMYRWHIMDPIRFDSGPARSRSRPWAGAKRRALPAPASTTSARWPTGTRRCRPRRSRRCRIATDWRLSEYGLPGVSRSCWIGRAKWWPSSSGSSRGRGGSRER